MNVDIQDPPDEYDRGYFSQLVEGLRASLRRVVDQGGVLVIGKGGHTIKGHFSAAVAWDPPNVAAGAQVLTTLTVPGARLSTTVDTVTAGFSADLQGMQLTGYVSATDTVTVVLRNGTAGAIDLAAGTLRADVWRH